MSTNLSIIVSMYEYNFEVTRVVDGDTVDGVIDLGFGIKMEQRVRLLGINAPEIYSNSKIENLDERKKQKELGLQARDDLSRLLIGADCIINTVLDKRGKYGRVLGTITKILPNTTINVNEWLVNNQLAVKT